VCAEWMINCRFAATSEISFRSQAARVCCNLLEGARFDRIAASTCSLRVYLTLTVIQTVLKKRQLELRLSLVLFVK
jgi:uncharacterized membrane protein YhfC